MNSKMARQELVYSGPLMLPSVGKILLKKTWPEKYCMLFRASKSGIERLEIYDSVDFTRNSPSRIITLENCIKITSNSPTHFTVTTKTAPYLHEFNANSVNAKNEWVQALQSVAFRDDSSLITSIEEDNDLYCSSSEPVFTVKIEPSAASKRCHLNSNIHYILILAEEAMHLRNSSDNKLLYTWPYRYIRRYGYKSTKFTFEAGRKCSSGEGTFLLEHSNQQEIFRCLSAKMKSMKKLQLQNVIDCDDSQLLSAVSMEARSRTPLLASSSFEQTKSLSESIRKLPTEPAYYEPVDKYDRIEYRSDAWKTLGVDDVNHSENLCGDDEEEVYYRSWGAGIGESGECQTKSAPTILTQSSVDGDDYDKLNFFGSSGKLDVKSGYKKVSLPLVAALPSPPSFNDYDEVQPAMESVRLADDSHLGYAIVRKDPGKEKIIHQFHNDAAYAVISKPKRV